MVLDLLAETSTGNSGDAAVGFIFMLAVFYFIPTVIALVRRVRNLASVIVINLFLGWTLIGWVVALAMAVRTKDS